MRTLGVSGGWMFFEHAGDAVAVDLATHDVTDVFAFSTLDQNAAWTAPSRTEPERRAALIARSALASRVDTLRAFAVPDTVRANARQAQYWTEIYGHQVELPLLSAGGLVPPASVQRAAKRVIDADLGRGDIARAEHLASGLPVNPQVVQQMQTYFSRHDKDKADPEVWLSWGGDGGRVWANRVTKAADAEAVTLTEKLADETEIDYDTMRLLPRAFSVVNGPHTSDCDGNGSCSCGGSKSSARYPSTRALTYLALGGDAGRAWAARTLEWTETAALTSAAYSPDANLDLSDTTEVGDQDGQDATAPHVFFPIIEFPAACTYCGQGELDEQHDPGAVSYYNADVDPATSHYFTEAVDNPAKCDICSKAVDDTLHKQAALASYYLYKQQFDKQIAETQQYWADKGQSENAVSAAAELFGVDWVEVPKDDLFERASAVDDKLDTLFWQRRGSEETDPLTYYAAYTGDDPMVVDQVYVNDRGVLYQFDADRMVWKQSALDNPSQVYELDDETALAAVRALAVYPDCPVELREVDPGEAMLMDGAADVIDDGMADRVVVVSASGMTFGDYTPEERSANATKQVRDAGGRFAKAGGRIAVGSNARQGTVAKIDPATQKVQVKFDDDGSSAWVDAKSTRMAPAAAAPADGSGRTPIVNLRKIPAIPRATASQMKNLPKGYLKTLLPPMNAKALKAVTENYPNFIAKERAGAHARAQAQKALDAKQKKYWDDQQQKIQNDYQRRLHKIHAQGKGLRDWVDNLYKKILPQPYRRQAIGGSINTEFARKKQDAAPAADPAAAPTANPAAIPSSSGQPITDPAQSDVTPLYLAEVDDANQQNVLDLLAMVPASTTGTDAQLLKYTATGWVSDPKELRKIQSSAPPTLVTLDEAAYNDTLTQVKAFYQTPEGKSKAAEEAKDAQNTLAAAAVYGEYGELLIASLPDLTPVERVRRYLTAGAGADKIRWGESGDRIRCMRLLKKYLPRPGVAEAYAAQLAHEMTGVWPGDHRRVGRRQSLGASGMLDTTMLTTHEVIAYAALVAGVAAVDAGIDAPATVDDVPTDLAGAPFVIPVVAPVGIKSGDGRSFAPLSLSIRDLPLPLLWQIQTAEGHDSSVIVGRIDEMQRAEDGSLVNARGVFDTGPYGQEAERLVRNKFLRGVSVDLDNFEAEARNTDEADRQSDRVHDDGVVRIHADDMTVTNGRVMAATLVAKPAFQEVQIQLDDGQGEEEAMVADGTYIGTPGTEAETEEMVRTALTAAGIPVHPPLDWFHDPELKQETPLTITDDGRVFGHIATWNSDHIGLPFSTRPPRSRSEYAYFHTGLLRTEDGTDISVGQITLAGGHAPLDSDAAMAVKHYDDTASAMCDVHAGEDAYGIWVAGALRPDVSAEQIRAIRASAPSGDWRPIHGRLELVAVCQVNVPGFPVTRARVASGKVYALVAAGTATLARLRAEADDAPIDALIARVDALEAPQREALEAAREAALARIEPVREERNAQLSAAREAALDRFNRTRAPEAAAVRDRVMSLMQDGDAYFREVSTEKRKNLAKKGHAMPNGGYPIESVGDLKNAIRAYGRAASGEKAAVRRHIKKRARALGKTDLIPESWASMSTPTQEIAGEIEDLAARMALISAGGHYPNGEPWDATQHPRDEKGKFRLVIAELKDDLEGQAGTADAVDQLNEAQDAADSGDMQAAQDAAKGVLALVDKIAAKTVDPDAVKTLRQGYTDLADAVANLPLAFGDLNQKYRFSDLPTPLQGLINDLYKRAEQQLSPEDMDKAGGKIQQFTSGIELMSQPEISAELSRLLRFLI